jgi:hypothetical protein
MATTLLQVVSQIRGARRYHGFENRTDSTLGMSGSNFQVTTAGSYRFWINGKQVDKTTTQQVAISTDQALHFVYFDTAGVLQVSTSAWDLVSDNVPVAAVFKDSTNYLIYDERHGYLRNREWHKWAHNTIGARYQSGFTGTFDNTTLSLTQGVVADEDIAFDSGGTKTNCALFYRNSGLTSMRMVLGVTTPYKAVGSIQYDNAGTLANVTPNWYVNSYVFATNSAAYPIIVVVGQNQHVSLNSARAEVAPTVLLSMAEWKLLYRVTYQSGESPAATYIEKQDYRLVSTGPATAPTSMDHFGLTGRDAANSHPLSAINVVDATADTDPDDTDKLAGYSADATANRTWELSVLKTYFQSGLSAALTFNEPAANNSAGTVSIFDSVTVGESVAFPDLLYLKSDGKWWKADADAASTMPGLRMALESKSADQTCNTLVAGRVRDDNWNWTVGGLIYASTTSGALTQTAPSGTTDIVQIVGVAYHADKMIFFPDHTTIEIA